jgi:hypothetical protein
MGFGAIAHRNGDRGRLECELVVFERIMWEQRSFFS